MVGTILSRKVIKIRTAGSPNPAETAKQRHPASSKTLGLTQLVMRHTVRSVNTAYPRIRVRLTQECAAQSFFSGELEADESYFDPRRVRSKREPGAGGKTIVFGLLKRGECVHTEIVPKAPRATLQTIIWGKATHSSIHTDGWRGDDGLVDLGLEKRFRVNHGNNEFVKGSRHVNGIKSFWRYAKYRLA